MMNFLEAANAERAHTPGAPYLRSRCGCIGVPSELVRWGESIEQSSIRLSQSTNLQLLTKANAC